MSTTCPACQVGHLKAIKTTYARVYDDTLIQVPNIAAWKCDICGETLYDPETIRRLEVLIGEAGPPPNRHVSPPALAGNDLPPAAEEGTHPRPK